MVEANYSNNTRISNIERQPLVDEFPDRHPSVMHLLRWLEPNPKLPQDQYAIAGACASLAKIILFRIENDDPEMAAGLRKLLEAKDCFVRASIDKV